MSTDSGELFAGALFVTIRVPAENGLGVQRELSRSLVQVVRMVEGGKLQFLFPRVALPSKLFACATWGPVDQVCRASAMIQLDPHKENYFSKHARACTVYFFTVANNYLELMKFITLCA